MKLKHLGYVIRSDSGQVWAEVEESIEGRVDTSGTLIHVVFIFPTLISARKVRDSYVKTGHIHEVFYDESEYIGTGSPLSGGEKG